MDIQETIHGRIEAYLKGTLSAVQQVEFEQELQSDEALQNEVDRHRKAVLAINYGLSQSLKSRLKMIDKELAPPVTSTSRRLPLFTRIAAAASVLILIAAGTHFYAHRTYSTDTIANNLFAQASGEEFRGQGEYVISLSEKFADAEKLFRDGNYENAKRQYLEIIKENSLLKEQAEWNLTLCYYAMDPSSLQFKTLFDRIRTDIQHDYHSEALELQHTMNGLLYKLVNR